MIAKTQNDMGFTTIKSATFGEHRDVIDPAEARTALDFNIIVNPSFTQDGRPIPGHNHLRRSTDDSIIPSRGIGDEFKPYDHWRLFDFITENILPACPDMKLETVCTLHGGGTGLVTATMGEDFKIAGDDSPHETRLMFVNPCNGNGSLMLGFSMVRIFCQNQIAKARKSLKDNGGFFIQHTKNAQYYVAAALKSIQRQVWQAQAIRNQAEALAHMPCTTDAMAGVIERIYPIQGLPQGSQAWARRQKVRDEVMAQFEQDETFTDKTMWAAFNAFTQPIFNPRTLSSRADGAEVQYSGMVGDRAKKVNHIWNVFGEVTGVSEVAA